MASERLPVLALDIGGTKLAVEAAGLGPIAGVGITGGGPLRRTDGVNGELHRGAAGNGGEFGHFLVRSGGRRCLCGRLGCLEIYASGNSIAERAREAVAERGSTSALALVPELRAEHVSAAADAQHLTAENVGRFLEGEAT
jgi:hypothetical protein